MTDSNVTDLSALSHEPDASKWAAAYKKTFPDADEELMLAWFANAMMAMHDYLEQKECTRATAQQAAEIAELRAEVERLKAGIKAFLPKNVALDNANIADDMVVPIEGPIGELRTLAALAREGEG